MKIPETANGGAYYGTEENGQWQPNGVIMDNGVGGGVVGSGDAGIHRPSVYPVHHIPRRHMPGYVMAGAYYPPGAYPAVAAPVPDDFADYMWMENEEEFDNQVMKQLEEEALMEQCIEAMLEDEQRERNSRVANGHNNPQATTSNGGNPSLSLEETVSRSTLNPLAAEFVPTRRVPPPATEDKLEHTEDTQKVIEEQPQEQTERRTETTEELKTDEPVPPPKDPPEVSAADVKPVPEPKPKSQDEKRPKDTKKEQAKPRVDTKKPVKVDVKKTKPATVKSEPKVQPKKKEVKVVKSEPKVEDEETPAVDVPKSQSAPATEESPSTGDFKPINYAAAAKANKPKKPASPPATDKNTPPPPLKTDKTKTITPDKPERKDPKAKIEKSTTKIEKGN